METTIVYGDYIGLYRVCVGIAETKMETAVMGLYRV